MEDKQEDEIYCPNCGKSIKKDYAICPYCRTEIKKLSNIEPEIPQNKSKENQNIEAIHSRAEKNFPKLIFKTIGILIFIAVVILLMWACFKSTSGGSSTPTTKSENSKQNTAYLGAQQTVKKMLKAPSTAKFPYPSDSDVSIKKLAEDKYFISSYVDSENSFGAMIRNTFTVTITLQGQNSQGDYNYKSEDLNINE